MYTIAGEIGLLHPPPVLRTFPMDNSTASCDLLLQYSFSARAALAIILDVPGHPVRSVRPFSISLQHFLILCTLVTQSPCAAIGWRWIWVGETFLPLKASDPANFFVGQSFQSRCHYKSTYPVNIVWLILTQSVAFYPQYEWHLLPKNKVLY